MVDLRLLKIFVTVARHGSMTAAARELGLTQSAVSQSVRQLEDALGVVLVDRERRPMAMTTAGALLEQRGCILLDEAQSLFTTVRETGGLCAQEIRIGLMDSFALTVGNGLIHALGDAAVRLSVTSGLSFELGNAFGSRKLDMLVTSDPMIEVAVLERHVLLSEPFVLLLPGVRADLRNEPLSEIARRLPLVRFARGSHIAGQIDAYLENEGIVAARRYEIDSAENLTAMVATHPAWAITTPLCMLQARHWRTDVFTAALTKGRPYRSVYLVARSGEYADLPGRIAAVARGLYRDHWTPIIRDMMPWIVAHWSDPFQTQGDAASGTSTTSMSSHGPRNHAPSAAV